MTAQARQFLKDAAAKTADRRHRAVLQKTIGTYSTKVAEGKQRFASWENARSRAAAIKWDAINHLADYLELFERKVGEGAP